MPSVTPGQTSAQDRRGSRAHPSGSGPTGSLAASRLPGGWDGVVAPASTGSLVCRAERWVSWEPPALPPTPKGVSAHDPVHGPSVSAWISHDSSDFWNILEGSLDPSFQRCRILRTVTTASTVLPGGGGHHLQPTARPAPGLGRRLGPGTAWGVTQHVAAPLPGVRTFTRLLLPLTSVFFTGLNRCKAGGLQPVQAELSPYGGCLVRWSPAVGSSDDRPPAPGPALWPVPPAVPTWG